MSKRLIATVRNDELGNTVRVYWDADWQEYTARLIGAKNADCYDTDKQSIMQTAEAMAKCGTLDIVVKRGELQG